MERGKNVFAGLLILSVCLNLYGLGRINALTEEIRQSRHEVSRLQHYIDSGLASVRSTVEGIREEERWMSRVSVSRGEPSGNLMPVTLTWQLKECPVNASVTLFLKGRDEPDFTPYPAESTGGGGFKVQLEHPIQPEPQVSFTFSTAGTSGSNKHESVLPESAAAYVTGGYEYYVTMTDGREMRTTGVSSLSIDQLGSNVAPPVSVDIQADEAYSSFLVGVHETPKPDSYFYHLQGVSIRVLYGGEIIKEVVLASERTIESPTPGGKVPVFEGVLEDYRTPSEVLLVLDYGSGVATEVPVKYLMDPGRFF